MYKTTLVYFFVRGANGLFALASAFVLTRIMSPSDYGIYALGTAAVGVLSSILFQWIAVTISRFYSAHIDNPSLLIWQGFTLFCRISAIPFLIAAGLSGWAPTETLTPAFIWLVAVGCIVMGWHSVSLQIANVQIQPLRYGGLTITRAAVVLAGAALLVSLGYGALGALLAVVLGNLAAIVGFGARVRRHRLDSEGELRQQMTAYGAPLVITYMATMVLDFSDRFIIGYLMGPASVAGYAAAYDLCQQTVGVALNVFFLVSFPRITRAWEQSGQVAARNSMDELGRSILLIFPLVVGGFVGFSKDIAGFFFGEGVRGDAEIVIPWVAIGVGVACFKSYYFDVAFQLAKRTLVQVKINLAIALCNVFLCVVLLRVFGLAGAAMATVAAFSIGILLSWLFGKSFCVYGLQARDFLSCLLVLIFVVGAARLNTGLGYGYLEDLLLRVVFFVMLYIVASWVLNLGRARDVYARLFGRVFSASER